jgi:UDP-glucuronate 4-epimerase
MQPGDVQDTYADISAITDDLGFKPAIGLDEGVPSFVRWLREYRKV